MFPHFEIQSLLINFSYIWQLTTRMTSKIPYKRSTNLKTWALTLARTGANAEDHWNASKSGIRHFWLISWKMKIFSGAHRCARTRIQCAPYQNLFPRYFEYFYESWTPRIHSENAHETPTEVSTWSISKKTRYNFESLYGAKSYAFLPITPTWKAI